MDTSRLLTVLEILEKDLRYVVEQMNLVMNGESAPIFDDISDRAFAKLPPSYVDIATRIAGEQWFGSGILRQVEVVAANSESVRGTVAHDLRDRSREVMNKASQARGALQQLGCRPHRYPDGTAELGFLFDESEIENAAVAIEHLENINLLVRTLNEANDLDVDSHSIRSCSSGSDFGFFFEAGLEVSADLTDIVVLITLTISGLAVSVAVIKKTLQASISKSLADRVVKELLASPDQKLEEKIKEIAARPSDEKRGREILTALRSSIGYLKSLLQRGVLKVEVGTGPEDRDQDTVDLAIHVRDQGYRLMETPDKEAQRALLGDGTASGVAEDHEDDLSPSEDNDRDEEDGQDPDVK